MDYFNLLLFLPFLVLFLSKHFTPTTNSKTHQNLLTPGTRRKWISDIVNDPQQRKMTSQREKTVKKMSGKLTKPKHTCLRHSKESFYNIMGCPQDLQLHGHFVWNVAIFTFYHNMEYETFPASHSRYQGKASLQPQLKFCWPFTFRKRLPSWI